MSDAPPGAAVDAVDLPTEPAVAALHLPISRHRCYIDLWMRDPDWAWTQWELTAEGVEATLRKLGVFSTHARLVVRLYNVPRLTYRALQDTSFVDEFGIDEWVGSRYLLLGRPDTYHSVSIGLHDTKQAFQAIARSPWIRAPRSASLLAQDPTFITVSRVVAEDGRPSLVVKPVT